MNTMEEIRLNLGSRYRKIPGFKNIDIHPHPGVDIVANVGRLPFEDNSVSEIFASNILEHFSHRETLEVLKEWRRALRPAHKLHISVPDFLRAMELGKVFGLCDWVENFLMGDQEYETAYHYALFDEPRLRDRLRHAGFNDISRVEFFEFADKEDCSNLVSDCDLKPVCLNMTAIK